MKAYPAGKCVKVEAENATDVNLMRSWVNKKYQTDANLISQGSRKAWPFILFRPIQDEEDEGKEE